MNIFRRMPGSSLILGFSIITLVSVIAVTGYPTHALSPGPQQEVLFTAEIPAGLDEIRLEVILPSVDLPEIQKLQVAVTTDTAVSSGELIYYDEFKVPAGTVEVWNLAGLQESDSVRHLVVKGIASKENPIFFTVAGWNSWDPQKIFSIELESDVSNSNGEDTVNGFNIGGNSAAGDLSVRTEFNYFYTCEDCTEVKIEYTVFDLQARRRFQMQEKMVRSRPDEYHASFLINDFITEFGLGLEAGYVEVNIGNNRNYNGVTSVNTSRTYRIGVSEVKLTKPERPPESRGRKTRREGRRSLSISQMVSNHASVALAYPRLLTDILLETANLALKQVIRSHWVEDDTGLERFEPIVTEHYLESPAYTPTPTPTPEPCTGEHEYLCVAPDLCCVDNPDTGYYEYCDEEAEKCVPPIECKAEGSEIVKWCDPDSEQCCSGTDFAECADKDGSCCPEGGGCDEGEECCGDFCLDPEEEICCDGKPCNKDEKECIDTDEDGEGDLCCEIGKGCGTQCCYGDKVCLDDTKCCNGPSYDYPPVPGDVLCNGECCAYPKRCWRDSRDLSDDGTGMCRNLRLCGQNCGSISTPCCQKSDPMCGPYNPIFDDCESVNTVGDGH